MSTPEIVEASPRLIAPADVPISFVPSVAPGGQGPSYLLASNESPFEPPPAVVEAIRSTALGVNRYPDAYGSEVANAVSVLHGVPRNAVMVAAGSVALLQTLFQAIAYEDSEVLFGWRSFELYPVIARLAGVESVTASLVGSHQDIDALLSLISRRTRMVVLCNPNNPTGTAVRAEELHRLLSRIPEHVLVALDEAYFEYVSSPGVVSGLTLWRKYPNLVTLRTLSKAYGLAGLRVGYLVGEARLVARLRRLCIPYSVSSVAQSAAVAALAAQPEMRERVTAICDMRSRLRDGLRAVGLEVPTSDGNFLWLACPDIATELAAHCAAAGIAIRVFAGEGIRVTIGSEDQNNAFRDRCESFLGTMPRR